MDTLQDTIDFACPTWQAVAIRKAFAPEKAEILVAGGLPDDWDDGDQQLLDTTLRRAAMDRTGEFRD